MENFYVSSENVDLSQILHTIGDAISLTDSKMTFLGVNTRFAELYGVEPKDLIGVNAFEVYPEFKSSVFYEAFEHTIRTGEEATRIGYSNKLKTWIVSRSAKFDDNRYIAISQVLRSGFSRVGFVSNYDSLTSLHNRYAFENDIHQYITKEQSFGVALIDIKSFRYLNECHGLEFGDLCLMETAARIKGALQHHNNIYRVNADQFSIIIPIPKDECRNEIKHILSAFKKPIIINGEACNINLNAGYHYVNNPLESSKEVLNCLEAALAQAKRTKHSFCEYDGDVLNLKDKLTLVQEFKSALKNGQFNIHYQAQVEMFTYKICGIEALIRWAHPTRGILPPGEFLQLAEEYELIEDLDKLVIINAFKDSLDLKSRNINIPLAINISAQSISNKHFVEYVGTVLNMTKINPNGIVFELTETTLANDIICKKNIIKLRDLGFQISIDDFGTGYASFRYLIQYPSDYLKIDRSFITDIHKNKTLKSIVNNMIKMAHSLGITVIAEGSECMEEVKQLKEFECDIVQGFVFSKPVPKDSMLKLIERKGISNRKSSID